MNNFTDYALEIESTVTEEMKSFEIIYEIHVNKTVIIARHMRG
jgi:hypothetical protein